MPTINKTTTILPGECFTLPKGAVITAVSGVLANSCEFDLPTPQALKCYKFEWEVSNGDPATQAWEDDDTDNKVTDIVSGTFTKNVNLGIYDHLGIFNALTTFFSPMGIVPISHGDAPVAGDRALAFVTFKTFASVIKDFYLKIDLSGSEGDIRIYPKEITCP